MLGSEGEEAKIGGTFRADLKDGWVEAHRKAREILEGVQRRQKKYYDLRKRTTIYEVGDVVLKKNNAGVLGSSKKLNPVYSPFSDRVGLPLHNTPFPGVLMKNIGAFFRPDALPDVNHMRGMQYVLNVINVNVTDSFDDRRSQCRLI